MYDLMRGVRSRFASEQSYDSSPIWSKDGTSILYAAGKTVRLDSDTRLWMKAAGGAESARPLAESALGLPTGLTPDGRAVLVVSGSPFASKTRIDIWHTPLDGGKPTPVLETPFIETDAQISPDGRWLAYVSDENGAPDVYIQPYPVAGSKWRLSRDGGSQIRWNPSSRELFFVSPRNELVSVAISATGPAPNQQLLFADAVGNLGRSHQYAVAKNGQRFLMIAPAGGLAESPPLTVVVNWPELVRRAASR